MLLPVLGLLLAAATSMDETMTQEQAVSLAKQVASKHLTVPAAQISLQHTEAVDWPDSSLGCPQPDMMYLQVITPGFKVLLKASGKIYPVHVGGTQAVMCLDESTKSKTQTAPAKAK